MPTKKKLIPISTLHINFWQSYFWFPFLSFWVFYVVRKIFISLPISSFEYIIISVPISFHCCYVYTVLNFYHVKNVNWILKHIKIPFSNSLCKTDSLSFCVVDELLYNLVGIMIFLLFYLDYYKTIIGVDFWHFQLKFTPYCWIISENLVFMYVILSVWKDF